MNFSFEEISQGIKKGLGDYKGRMNGARRPYMGPGFPAVMKDGEHFASRLNDTPSGLENINRNSAIGATHGVVKAGMEQLMGKSASGYAATGLMAAGGLGAAAGINSFNSNHPGATPFTAGAGILAVGAAAIDPALLGTMFKSGVKSGEKMVSKVGEAIAPGETVASAPVSKPRFTRKADGTLAPRP